MTGAIFSRRIATGLVALDCADTRADIATDADFGRCRGKQELALGHLGQVVPEEVRTAVAHQAGDLDLVHGVDHGGRRAVPSELEHDVRRVPDRAPRDHRARSAPGLESSDSHRSASKRLRGKSGFPVDIRRSRTGNSLRRSAPPGATDLTGASKSRHGPTFPT